MSSTRKGAGILPITIKDNKIYFLFGRENKYNDTPGWADFGGGIEKNENVFSSAIREGWEESTGFLGSPEEIKKKILKNKKRCIKLPTYTTYLLPIDYDEKMIKYFNLAQNCIQKNLSKKIITNTYIFEKQEIKWFSFEEMEKNIHSFRSFYQQIIQILLNKKEEFKKYTKRKKAKKTKTKKKYF